MNIDTNRTAQLSSLLNGVAQAIPSKNYEPINCPMAAFLLDAATWSSKQPFYWLATTEQISCVAYRADLKRAVAAENIGEREWLTALADALLHVDMKGGRIWRSPEPYPIPFVDEIIRNDRYMRDFMWSDRCQFVERDKLIDLYFRVMRPQAARRFGR